MNGVRRGHQRGHGASAIALVALVQLCFEPGCLFRIAGGVVLQNATIGTNVRLGVEKDLYLCAPERRQCRCLALP